MVGTSIDAVVKTLVDVGGCAVVVAERVLCMVLIGVVEDCGGMGDRPTREQLIVNMRTIKIILALLKL